ncbi:MAG: SEC-C metal-binding domain-containing protein [Eubacteriales bacterium]|nr:SEC-C metal-binding domain-containing protein [Eubacteriales bacterium]
MKIGRNDPCPCRNGKKYKKCCLGKDDDAYYSNPLNFLETYKKVRKEARIKQCLHPQEGECSEKIIGAHSIQNNKIIKRLSSNGIVYMPCPKSDNPFAPMTVYGRKEATLFTGFCGYHDKTVFQPIEDGAFNKSVQHIFLYTYRCFAVEYHKKQEVINMEKITFKIKPSLINMEKKDNFYRGMHMAVNDFQSVKESFDTALLTENYDILSSVVWEFDQAVKFAGTGFEAMTHDLDGNNIQDLLNFNIPAKHIFAMVFPEGDKTYCIISWLKENDSLFDLYKQQLLSLPDEKRKIYINNLLPMISENIVVNPESWGNWEEYKRNEFGAIEFGIATLFESEGEYWDRLEPPTYDLFEL